MLKLKEPVSSLTHLLGAMLSVVGLILLVVYSATQATTWHVVSFSIFGISLILLYTASGIYHGLALSERKDRLLRKVDHMMIYILIAGTYTPMCLVALRGPWGWSLFGSIWGLAIIGIVLKAFWLNAPRWLYTSFYLLMGWLVVIAIYPLMQAVPLGGIIWLVIGGMFYTIGAAIYATKWPKLKWQHFGFHEIFHLFIMAGSFSHFWMMLKYILYIR